MSRPDGTRVALTAAFVGGLYLFLLALDGFTASWRLLFSLDSANELVVGNVNRMLENPLVGFFLGLFITSLIQSSSATIAIIISYIVAQDAPVSLCIPVILGANIGTTVTNTLVALGHSFEPAEFRRVAPAAVVDDLFKLINVSLFFLLELAFGLLTRLSQYAAGVLGRLTEGHGGSVLLPDFIDFLTRAPVAWWLQQAGGLGDGWLQAMLSGGLSFVVLLTGLHLMGAALGRLFETGLKKRIQQNLGSPGRGAVLGFATCWVLQSSSVTTSLMMPLVAHGLASLRHAYHFALGAAVGTTADSSQIVAYLKYGAPGLAAGIVHIAVNLFGAAIFIFVPGIRNVPIALAERLGNWLGSSRWAPVRFSVAVALVFYVVPLLLITIM